MNQRLFGIVGYKNNGKTTLVERLVAHFTRHGLAVSTVKHTHHALDLDQPGKDSYRHRAAGAREVLLTCGTRWALLHEGGEEEPEPPLDSLLPRLGPADLILVEGFKHFPHPKLEVHRAERQTPLLARHDGTILAVASDAALEVDLPRFGLDDVEAIAGFITATIDLRIPPAMVG